MWRWKRAAAPFFGSHVSGSGVGGEIAAAEVGEGLCCEQQDRCQRFGGDCQDFAAATEASYGAGEVGCVTGSDDAAWFSAAGAEDARTVLQLDPRLPVGTGAGGRALEIACGRFDQAGADL